MGTSTRGDRESGRRDGVDSTPTGWWWVHVMSEGLEEVGYYSQTTGLFNTLRRSDGP